MEPNLYYSNNHEIYIICYHTKRVYTTYIDTNTFKMIFKLQGSTLMKHFITDKIPITTPSFPIIVN